MPRWIKFACGYQHLGSVRRAQQTKLFRQVIAMSNPFEGYLACVLGHPKGTRFHTFMENCRAAASSDDERMIAQIIARLEKHHTQEPARLVLEAMYSSCYNERVRERIRVAAHDTGPEEFVRHAYSCVVYDPYECARVRIMIRDRTILGDLLQRGPFTNALDLAMSVVDDKDPLAIIAKKRFGKLPEHLLRMGPTLHALVKSPPKLNATISLPVNSYSAAELLAEVADAATDCNPLPRDADAGELAERRQEFIGNFGWCIPNAEMIAEIANFIGDRRALSVGAGRALVEFLLYERGVNITATDSLTDEWAATNRAPPFMPVHMYSAARAVRVFDPDVLVLVWPPYQSDQFSTVAPMASDALRAFRGSRVVYIGEDSYGCTGDPAFHALLDDEWIPATEVDDDVDERALQIDNWYGLHDYVQLFIRTQRPVRYTSFEEHF
jgi:hypothetical protein